MSKTLIALFLILIAVLSLGGVYSYADENENISELKFNKATHIDDDSEVFEIDGEGKNKTQFRIKQSHDDEDEDSEFMIKGIISASSSSSITINGKIIKIDSSFVEELKIVGKIEVGAYAMAKGIVKDSSFYAEKIVIDQRNKKDIDDEDEDDEDEEVHPSISPSPTPSVTPTATPSSTIEADEDNEQKEERTLNRLILSLENILSSLRKFVFGI